MKNNDGFKTILSTSSITGIIFGVGYLIYEIVRPKTLRDKLVKEGIQILDKDISDVENKRKWKRLSSRYGKRLHANKRFSDLDLSKNVVKEQSERIKQLQDKCETALNTLIQAAEEMQLKEKVLYWCTSTSEFAKGKQKSQR